MRQFQRHVARARTKDSLKAFSELTLRGEPPAKVLDVYACIPEVQVAHVGEGRHRPSI